MFSQVLSGVFSRVNVEFSLQKDWMKVSLQVSWGDVGAADALLFFLFLNFIKEKEGDVSSFHKGKSLHKEEGEIFFLLKGEEATCFPFSFNSGSSQIKTDLLWIYMNSIIDIGITWGDVPKNALLDYPVGVFLTFGGFHLKNQVRVIKINTWCAIKAQNRGTLFRFSKFMKLNSTDAGWSIKARMRRFQTYLKEAKRWKQLYRIICLQNVSQYTFSKLLL